VARDFPEITNFGTAFRFALEAEAAAGDIAAAAQGLAPDEAWRAKLEELACTHDDRVQKFRMIRQEVNEMTLEPISDFDGERYLAALTAEPARSWPEAAEQVIAAEDDVAAFHDDFVAHADDVLAAASRAFTRAAKQERQKAEELRGML